MSKNKWFYINTGINNGKFNMLCDALLLNLLVNKQISYPILRLYGWSEPTLSLGVSQSIEDINDKKFSNIPVVQRITGGQAVLHSLPTDELTYSVFLFSTLSAKKLYKYVGNVLISFLSCFGLDAAYGYSESPYFRDFDCFSSKTVADIVSGGVKIIGSAQYKKKNCILQHGSVRLNRIKELSKINLTFESAADSLKAIFEKNMNVEFLNCENLNNVESAKEVDSGKILQEVNAGK